MTEPLEISVELECPADHAFRTWTEGFATWWPSGHTVSGADDVQVILEPRLGGRIFERTIGGEEIDWGEITEWSPPRRFSYLWHIRRDRGDATDVAISFADLEPGRCRLDIVHTGWERLGAEAETWRNANRGGWAGLLPHFIAVAGPATAPTSGEGSTR